MVFDVLMSAEQLEYVRVQLYSERARLWSRDNMHILDAMKIDEATFDIDEGDFEAVVLPFVYAGLAVALNGTQVFVKPNGRVTYLTDEAVLDEWTEKILHYHATHAHHVP